MVNPKPSQTAAQKNAQHYFRKADERPDALGKQMRKKERTARATNTARLRELRLAKEAAEKKVESGAAEPPARGKPARKARTVVRMTY